MKRAISVLVVDDDEDIRAILAELLEEEGYTVTTAANGVEALEVLREVVPEMILLDLSMPIMSGQQFRAEQLGDPALAAIPTIVMTAADRMHEKTSPMQVADTLAKPISMDRLLETVARYAPSGAGRT